MTESSHQSIPLLNAFPTLHGLRDGIRVRFRAMVQDSLDRVLKHKSYGEYDLKHRRGLEGVPHDYKAEFSKDFYSVDRYVLVSVPGLRGCDILPAASLEQYFEKSGNIDEKRVLHQDQNSDPMDTDMVDSKRCRSAEVPAAENDEPPSMVPVDESEAQEALSDPPKTQHPIPSHMAGICARYSCLASYCTDDIASTDLKLHDVVEVEGFVHVGPSENPEDPNVDFTMEVVSVNKVTNTYHEISAEEVIQARRALKTVLTNLVKDEVVAEYLLLHLVSSRIPGNTHLPTMGSWTLNVANVPQVDLLVKFLESIHAKPFVYIPASNENLLKEKFYPHRTADREFTAPGILQLSNSTTVVLDENHMKEGPVNSLNIVTISKAVKDQVLLGIFGSDDFIEFPVDLKFLILSSGKSLFAENMPGSGVIGHVPFVHIGCPDVSCEFTEGMIKLAEADRELIRNYLCSVQDKLACDTNIEEETIQEFQNAWVQHRKENSAIPTDDIHIWATLLKVYAASHGEKMANRNHLSDLLNMEESRRTKIGQPSAVQGTAVAGA